MNLNKKLKEIDEHFKNISQEEFNENLIKSGYGVINPSGLDMIVVSEYNE